jgi:hypothetical protein
MNAMGSLSLNERLLSRLRLPTQHVLIRKSLSDSERDASVGMAQKPVDRLGYYKQLDPEHRRQRRWLRSKDFHSVLTALDRMLRMVEFHNQAVMGGVRSDGAAEAKGEMGISRVPCLSRGAHLLSSSSAGGRASSLPASLLLS